MASPIARPLSSLVAALILLVGAAAYLQWEGDRAVDLACSRGPAGEVSCRATELRGGSPVVHMEAHAIRAAYATYEGDELRAGGRTRRRPAGVVAETAGGERQRLTNALSERQQDAIVAAIQRFLTIDRASPALSLSVGPDRGERREALLVAAGAAIMLVISLGRLALSLRGRTLAHA